MGKNTMMRKAIRGHLDKNPQLERYSANASLAGLLIMVIKDHW